MKKQITFGQWRQLSKCLKSVWYDFANTHGYVKHTIMEKFSDGSISQTSDMDMPNIESMIIFLVEHEDFMIPSIFELNKPDLWTDALWAAVVATLKREAEAQL